MFEHTRVRSEMIERLVRNSHCSHFYRTRTPHDHIGGLHTGTLKAHVNKSDEQADQNLIPRLLFSPGGTNVNKKGETYEEFTQLCFIHP